MMDATQVIQDFPYDDEEEDDSGDEEETLPVAKLKVFTNEHVPETGESFIFQNALLQFFQFVDGIMRTKGSIQLLDC